MQELMDRQALACVLVAPDTGEHQRVVKHMIVASILVIVLNYY
jgi:hypothetical protein